MLCKFKHQVCRVGLRLIAHSAVTSVIFRRQESQVLPNQTVHFPARAMQQRYAEVLAACHYTLGPDQILPTGTMPLETLLERINS